MFKAVWRGWLRLARTIGAVQSRLILALVYFVVVAPFALAVRRFVDPLRLRAKPAWRRFQGESARDLDAMRRQF